MTLTGDFKKSPESIINDTHWRRGFGRCAFRAGATVTENRLQTGVNRVLQDFQRGDHLEAKVTLERSIITRRTNTVTPSLSIDSGPILLVQTSAPRFPRANCGN